MKRLLTIVFVLGSCVASAQAPPVYKDPHHRQVLYTNWFRILDVNIPAGEMGHEHAHERDVATVAIMNAQTRVRTPGAEWGPPRERAIGSLNATQYTGTPGAHTIQNLDKIPYRLIAVTNERESGWSTLTPMKAAGTTIAQQTRAFILYDVKLDAATPESDHNHQRPTVTVLVSGSVENQGDGGTEPFRIQEPGRWIYTPAGGHTLRTVAGTAAHAVEFEVR
ncbi:MAG: hypothetical protein FJW14_00420 [Acidimicrobiia bacterium]|nr:hypothetical protein [Acidimicrobiia bacterium]